MEDGAPSPRQAPNRSGPLRRGIAFRHRGRTSVQQRVVNQISEVIGRPSFLAVLAFGVAAWIGVNLIVVAFGRPAFDSPGFIWLQGAVNLFSLFIVTLVLVAQKHADELNARRDDRTLELAILSERKIAKVIELSRGTTTRYSTSPGPRRSTSRSDGAPRGTRRRPQAGSSNFRSGDRYCKSAGGMTAAVPAQVEDLQAERGRRHQPRDRPVLVEPVCADIRRRAYPR